MNRPCPICKKSMEWETGPFRPFCSERCRMIDLGAWASEKYRIEAEDKNEKPSPSELTDAAVRNGQEG